MPTMEKFIQYADAVCDCLPIVSTITNGAQYLYKLAHTVDAVANPVEKGFKTELKIHVLSKENTVMLCNMVPILGNLTGLLWFCVQGVQDNLMSAVISNNREVVRLRLANGYLQGDPEQRQKILRQAANCSNLETFEAVLNAKNDWTQDDIIEGLQGCWCPHLSSSQNDTANALLTYWEKTWQDQPALEGKVWDILRIIPKFVKAEKEDIVLKLIQLLPNTSFDCMKDLLKEGAFNYHQYSYLMCMRKEGYSLSPEALTALLAKCTQCSLHELLDYAGHVSFQRKELLNNPDSNPAIEQHDQIQLQVLNHFLSQVDKNCAPPDLATLLAGINIWWDKEFMSAICAFSDKMPSDDQLFLLQICHEETFSFWLDRLGNALTNVQMKQLLESCTKSDNFKAQLAHDLRQADLPYETRASKSDILLKMYPALKPVEEQAV